MLRKIVFILFSLLISISFANEIWTLEIDGVINPVAASYIEENLEKAMDARAECVIIQMDTPGGLMTSMRDIIKNILNSDVPVIVYVSPSGAQAASAGVFITVASHFSAMAPGTNIGAAHPVNVGGGGFMGNAKPDSAETKTMMEKVTNDAVAYIRSLAEQRGKDADWFEDAVRNSVSITENEAVNNNIVDFIAKDLDELLEILDGKTVILPFGEKVLNLSDKPIIHKPIGVHRKILNIISDPNVAYILLMLGFYGIFFEIRSPGAILPGAVGAVCLILAFFSFQILPINYAGLALIITGIILFILEVSITSFGLLTIGGLVCMILGSMMLIDITEAPRELFTISLKVIIPIVIFSAMFVIFASYFALKTLRKKVTTGKEGLIGEIGVVHTDIGPGNPGKVLVHGEFWNAEADEKIIKGQEITVISSKSGRMKLIVKKYNQRS